MITQKSKNRIKTLDSLHGLAVLSVVLLHYNIFIFYFVCVE